MEISIKDILTWGGMLVGLVGQFFHLKGRVSILEAKQNIQAKHHDDALDRIDRTLERIESKLDGKVDRS